MNTLDDDFYNFHSLGADDTEYSSPNHEPISMDGFDEMKDSYEYYNNPNVSFSNHNFPGPLNPRMVMIQQINDDGKEWSEEDISDLETDAKNDTLPPPSIISSNAHRRPMPHHNANGSSSPNYVNVNDLINKIGFGKFHYQLIFLCGLGYIADSMWSEAITLIITPIQNEWDVDNAYLGWLAATLFAGMCMGSFVWGRTSDVVGRKFPFTLTLTIGGITGMITAFMESYEWTLILLFCLGFGVGGNIPVDGAILAEFLPTSHRGSIMVSLSIFWALGDLVSAFLAFLIIPDRICHDKMHCDAADNLGWRYLIFTLGAINCCFLFFRLGANESPNYLICQGEGGRRRALSVLKRIAEINECPRGTVTNDMILQVDNPMLNRKLIQRLKEKQRVQHSLSRQHLLSHHHHSDDIHRRHSGGNGNGNGNGLNGLSQFHQSSHHQDPYILSQPPSVRKNGAKGGDRRTSRSSHHSTKSKTNSFQSIDLESTRNGVNGNTNSNGNGHNGTGTLGMHYNQSSMSPLSAEQSLSPHHNGHNTNGYHSHRHHHHHHSNPNSNHMNLNHDRDRSSPLQNVAVKLDMDMEAHRMTLGDIIGELFSNKTHGRNLRRATPLIWCAWFGSSFGLASFGVWLPKLMAAKHIHISSVYGDALILAIAQFPGPFIGAYMVETEWFGRRYTMTFSAFFISLFILLFIFVNDEIGLVVLSCLISLLAQVYYAGLMCFTPEAYPTDIRTTASGIATGVRHVANILGPLVTGKTFGEHGHTPLVMCAMTVMFASLASYLLPFDTRKKRLVPTVRVSL